MSAAWPTLKGDSGGTSSTDSRIAPPLSVRWIAEVADCAYGGASDGHLLAVTAGKDEVLCLQLSDGSVKWRTRIRKKGARLNDICALDEDRVYVAKDSCLLALRKDSGEVEWQLPEGPRYWRLQGIIGGDYLGLAHLGVSAADGRLLVNYQDDGAQRYQVGAAGGKVWCVRHEVTPESKAWLLQRYAVGSRKEDLSCEIEAHSLSAFAVTGQLLVCRMKQEVEKDVYKEQTVIIDAVSGAVRHVLPEVCHLRYCLVGDRLVFLRADNTPLDQEPSPPVLVCYDVRTGDKLWDLAGLATDRELGSWWNSPPIASGGCVWSTYPSRGKAGKAMTSLVAVDIVSGKLAGETAFPRWWFGELLAAGGSIIAVGGGRKYGDGLIVCFGPEGSGGGTGREPSAVAAAPKQADRKASAKAGRKPVRESRNGEYPLDDGRLLMLKPAKEPRSVLIREKDGRESELLALKRHGAAFDGVDVHAGAGTAFMRQVLDEGQAQELYVFDGQGMKLLSIKKDQLNCTSFAISPEGKRVACAFTFSDEPDDAQVRVFEIASGRELKRVALDDPTILAVKLVWQTDQALRFVNANPGADTESHHFELDLEAGALADLDE